MTTDKYSSIILCKFCTNIMRPSCVVLQSARHFSDAEILDLPKYFNCGFTLRPVMVLENRIDKGNRIIISNTPPTISTMNISDRVKRLDRIRRYANG